MKRATQGLLLAFLGAVLLRLSLSDAYLRYVKDWMQIPIILSGVLLLALAVGPILRPQDGDAEEDHGHDHGGSGVPRVTWLLLLPGIVAFVISPPALGAFLAERRSTDNVAAPEPAAVADLTSGEVYPMSVEELVWRAQELPEGLADVILEVSGFVSYDGEGGWYVTRMSIACCAADASAFRVKVEGDQPRPERDSWVEVTGTWVEGTGEDGDFPAVTATAVEDIPPPDQTYQ